LVAGWVPKRGETQDERFLKVLLKVNMFAVIYNYAGIV
jgi:hypothetical protein